MALAREQLRDTGDGIAAIAQSLGYASEFSDPFVALERGNHARATAQRNHSTTGQASSALAGARSNPRSSARP
jgi:hypothetical protein